MRLRIRHKVVFAIVGVNILLTLSLYLLNSWSFRNGFADYVKQVEEAKLTPMVEELAVIYQSEGNWDWIHTERRRWGRLLDKHLTSGKSNSSKRPPAPPRGSSAEFRRPPPPPQGSSTGFQPPPHFNRPPPPHGRPPGPRHTRPDQSNQPGRSKDFPPRRPLGPPPRGGTFSFEKALFLANEKKVIVIGKLHSIDKVQWKPILLNNKTIGYLGYSPKERESDQLDQIFSRQQQRNYAMASLGLVLFSILTGLLLASRMLKPILQLDKGAKKLIAGDYGHQLNYKSTDELGDLTTNFNLLADTLQQNLHARQQWIADISHELRTPVAILQAEIEAILDGVRNSTPESLTSLHTETKQLARLINDLHELTLSDLGALSYKMENIDIQEVIDDVVEMKTLELEDLQIKLTFEINPHPFIMVGDYQRLVQLFSNLMQNTLRYTDEGGVVHIHLHKISDTVRISWADSKPGVTSKQLPKLFDKLYRAESSRNRKTGGSGLGLAICKNIVEAHQGVMTAEYSDLGGLLILITLPLAPQTESMNNEI